MSRTILTKNLTDDEEWVVRPIQCTGWSRNGRLDCWWKSRKRREPNVIQRYLWNFSRNEPIPESDFIKAKEGRFIKSYDKALPGKHTNILYNGRTKKQSQILCQLRTGISRLNSYLANIQAVHSDQCRCNRGSETVDHFLFRCSRWRNLRQELKGLAGHRWGDLAYALGWWSNERKDGSLDRMVAYYRYGCSHN